MTAKELSQLYWLNKEVESLEQRLEELEALATSCTSQITGMPKSFGNSDKIGNYVAQICEVKAQIDEHMKRCFVELQKLMGFIESFEDSQIRLILTLKYVVGLTWEEVSEEIGYSVVHLQRLHRGIVCG